MNVSQIVEAVATVEQNSDSESDQRWVVAEVDLFASRLKEAASDIDDAFDRVIEEYGPYTRVSAEAEAVQRRIHLLAGYIELEVDYFRIAVKEDFLPSA
jgi:hypothetical protein